MRHHGLFNCKLFALFSILSAFVPCIVAATTYVVPPDKTMSATFTLLSADSIIVNDHGTLINNNSIIGYGSLTNNAGGTITNNGAFFGYASSSITNSGTITNSGLASFIGTYGSLTNNAGGTITNNEGWIDNRGSLTNNAGGTITNNNNLGWIDNYRSLTNNAGGTIINNGGLIRNISPGTITNSGTITNTNYGRIFNYPGATIYNNGLIINDTSSIIISGGTFTNATSGVLTNNGTFTQIGTFSNYGTLSGTGTIIGNITNDGTIAPGNSIGTMTVTGNYTHNAGAIYQVEVNGAGQSDRLVVSGTATLNGGKVNPVYSGIFPKDVPYAYTFLTAAAGVNGTFSELVNTSPFFDTSMSYFPTFVKLNLMRRGFGSVCETGNQCEVAGSIERIYTTATGDMRDFMNTLLTLNAPQARNAYDQMGGLSHTALTGATFSSFSKYVDVMSGRMSGFLSGGLRTGYAYQPAMFASRNDTASDAGNTVIAALNNAAGGNPAPTWGFWVQGYGALGERRGNDISSRYDHDIMGFAAGFDRAVTPSLLVGTSLGYGYTKVEMKDLPDNATVSSYQGSLYGLYKVDHFYLSGIAAYGYNHYDTSRDIAFGGINRSANALYNGQTFGGNLEAGYRIATRPVDIIPIASFTGIYLMRDGFSEKGAGALNLDADSDHASSLIGSLGMKFTKDYTMPSGIIRPELTVKWNHEFIDDDYVLNASFAGYPTSAFTAKGDRPDRDFLGVGLGLTWETKENVNIYFNYDGNFSGDSTQHAGLLGMRCRW